MNSKTKKPLAGRILMVAGALALVGAAAASCGTETTTVTPGYVYDDAYLYTAYYPADVAYSGYYWADSWNYATFYYLGAGYGGGPTPTPGAAGTTGAAGTSGAAGTTGAAGTSGAAGTTGAAGSNSSNGVAASSTLARTIEALARGEDVCPGQVTITPKFATPACADGTTTQERNGVTLAFAGCLTSGATITGMVDVQSNRSASAQTCSATTTIMLGHTTTITNLTVTGANGKIVIPSETDMAMTSYTFGQSPTTLSVNTTGELQLFNAQGTMLSDHTYTGDTTFTFSGNQSYKFSGMLNVQEKNGPATATITRTDVTRSAGCCRPTAGSITINRTSGQLPGQATWTWGPSCGTVMRDNVTVTLPACQ